MCSLVTIAKVEVNQLSFGMVLNIRNQDNMREIPGTKTSVIEGITRGRTKCKNKYNYLGSESTTSYLLVLFCGVIFASSRQPNQHFSQLMSVCGSHLPTQIINNRPLQG